MLLGHSLTVQIARLVMSPKPEKKVKRITPGRSLRPTSPASSPAGASAERLLGERIKRLRISKGWSQAELAARLSSRLEWAQTTVAKTEAASRPIRVDEAAAIAAVLGVPLRELLGERPNLPRLKEEAKVESLLLEHASEWARYRVLQREWDRIDHDVQDAERELARLSQEIEQAQGRLSARNT